MEGSIKYDPALHGGTVKRFLSIDPGSNKLGWAIIDSLGLTHTVPAHGLLKPKDFSKDSSDTIDASGFAHIYEFITKVCNRYKPEFCFVENFGVNRRRTGMFVVPRVKAIIELAWYHYAKTIPKTVRVTDWKQGLTGDAKAEKKDIANKLISMNIMGPVKAQDEYDAVGIGIGYLNFVNKKLKVGPKVVKAKRKSSKLPK
jgi:Holliday junction resolvasome RuvABC endonuclease subunit